MARADEILEKSIDEGKKWDDIDPKKMVKCFIIYLKVNGDSKDDADDERVEEFIDDIADEFRIKDADSSWDNKFKNELKNQGFKNI